LDLIWLVETEAHSKFQNMPESCQKLVKKNLVQWQRVLQAPLQLRTSNNATS